MCLDFYKLYTGIEVQRRIEIHTSRIILEENFFYTPFAARLNYVFMKQLGRIFSNINEFTRV